MRDIYRASSLFLLGLTLAGQPDFSMPTNNSPDSLLISEADRIVDITTFGQYGHVGGMGSLGFLDNGETIYDALTFVDNAVARHRRMEQAFGHKLEMHMDLPSYYTRITENGEKIVVFNNHTGEVIREYFDRTEKEGIDGTISICVVPPPGTTREDLSSAVDRIFSGEMEGLPKNILMENIDKITLTLDLEYMVMGELYAGGDSVNHVSIDFVKYINAHYVTLHQSLQREQSLMQTFPYTPQLNIYNFGRNSTDDMFSDEGTKITLPANFSLISDAIGSLEEKQLSTANFARIYGTTVSTMFFLPESPKLLNDGKQSDTGISPWDYEGIVKWAQLNSRAGMIMTH